MYFSTTLKIEGSSGRVERKLPKSQLNNGIVMIPAAIIIKIMCL